MVFWCEKLSHDEIPIVTTTITATSPTILTFRELINVIYPYKYEWKFTRYSEQEKTVVVIYRIVDTLNINRHVLDQSYVKSLRGLGAHRSNKSFSW